VSPAEHCLALAEIMARAVYNQAPVPTAGPSPLQWEDLDADQRDLMMLDQIVACEAAIKAGYSIFPPAPAGAA
jgi:hypothetical protein